MTSRTRLVGLEAKMVSGVSSKLWSEPTYSCASVPVTQVENRVAAACQTCDVTFMQRRDLRNKTTLKRRTERLARLVATT